MNLKTIRKERNMRQEDIARYLNVKQATYSGYENGKYEPTIETLCKLADYYKVSTDYLIGRKWNNDISYLTNKQIECVNMIKQLNETNLIKLMGYLSAMISMQ